MHTLRISNVCAQLTTYTNNTRKALTCNDLKLTKNNESHLEVTLLEYI